MINFIIYKFNIKWGWINLQLKYFIILFILVGVLCACNANIEPKEHLGEIYSVALDAIMQQNKELNRGMEFIAIDMSNFKNVEESDKEKILSYLKEKYKVDVMDATFEQLEEKGLYNADTMSLDGVLLTIDKVDFKFKNDTVFEVSKYHSNLGAVGFECRVHYKDNEWKAKEVKMTWIS